MSKIEKLQVITSVQLAKYFKGESYYIDVNLEDISELEIYELFESKTKGFDDERVKLILEVFLREPDENMRLIERYSDEVKSLEYECFDFELEIGWPECEEYKSYRDLQHDIDRYHYEIALLQKKSKLCDYIINLLNSKLEQSQQLETSEKRLLNSFFSKYPQAERIFKCCIKAGLLDDNYKPVDRYVETIPDKAFLADLIGKEIKIEERWKFFQQYWNEKGFANIISKVDNNYPLTIKHKEEITTKFNEFIKDKQL